MFPAAQFAARAAQDSCRTIHLQPRRAFMPQAPSPKPPAARRAAPSSAERIVVVGAGAAGLVAAIFAAGGSRRVVLLERTADGGRKILISGGGRCNILPSALHPERFVTASPPHLMRGLLRSWPLDEQRAFFERDAGIPLALEEETGKLFPRSNRARDVRDALVAMARLRGVEIRFGTTVADVARDGGRWRVDSDRGSIVCAGVILATGGLSVPTTGSDGTGLRIAAALGHAVNDTYPALTPILALSEAGSREAGVGGTMAAAPALLAGVSLQARLRARSHARVVETRGGFLFTHRGYSGPAVLDISHVLVRDAGAKLRASWGDRTAPQWERDLRPGAPVQVTTALERHLPARLAATLMADAGIPLDRRISDLRRAERTVLIDRLTACDLPWAGDEGYRKAEVTGGGVDLGDVDPRTLESRRHPGLYLCGEMLDAFGPIGGYNFAWAWATGRAAGRGSRFALAA
jgi:predicted Rossmann fold flavoprotein